MPSQIQCPGCDSSWVFDEAQAGGEFVCPTCMRPIALPGAAADEKAPAPTVATSRAPAAQPRQQHASPQPEEPSSPRSVGEGDEIVCPRCNLHFYPRGRKTDSSAEKRRTILIVEDQEYFRQIAADALDDEYEVRTAKNSSEARQILDQGGIDLLVLDLTLDGGDEGKRLLTGLTPKPCPILIFTAQDESELYGEHWEELSRLGADDLVMKGMQVGESLRKKARMLLGRPEEDDINA